jgi:transcriptional antiterminator
LPDTFAGSVLVSVNSIRALLGYPCANNIGQLRSDIQLLCARSYADYISRKKNSLNISSYMLPPNIRNGIFEEKNRKKIWNIMAGFPSRFVTFDGGSPAFPFTNKSHEGDIYNIIERNTEEMRRVGASEEQIDELIGNMMDIYYRRYDEKNETTVQTVKNLAGPEIMMTVDKMLAIASARLGRNFSDNIRYGLSLHLHNAIRRIHQGLPIMNPRLKNIETEWPEPLQAAKLAIAAAEQDFNIRFPADEADFVALFLVPEGHTSADRHGFLG